MLPPSSRLLLVRVARPTLVLLPLLALLAGACSTGRTRARDVAGDRRPRRDDAGANIDGGATESVPEPPPAFVPRATNGKKPRLVVRVSTRALAVDATNLYYGDSEEDGIFMMPKAGGEPTKLARHAPVAGAIALDGDSITWIASPGDSVLKLSLHDGGQPTNLRDRGIFSDVATEGGDIFITEAIGAGGALVRVTGPTAARIASFDGPPRAVMADAKHAYVLTPTKILRMPHERGEIETVATGTAFGSAEMDDAFVYVVAEIDKVRSIVAVPKAGGAMTTLVRDVRDAPIEVSGGEVFYVDGTRPELRAIKTGGGEPRVVAEDGAFAGATAIEADDATIYVATGSHESAAIVAIDRH